MFTLRSCIKSAGIIFFAMILTSFVAAPCSYPEGNNNQYADDSLQVCGPGYLNIGPNAAKRQADAIVAQQTSHKSMLQNVTEYLMGKTENKVEQAAIDKPKAVLQQRQSSGGGKVAKKQTVMQEVTRTITDTTTTTYDPTQISDPVKAKVQDYFTANNIGAAYTLKASGEKLYAVWGQGGAIDVQTFDVSGNALLANPVTVAGGTLNGVAALADGNIALVWTSTVTTGGRLMGGTTTDYLMAGEFGSGGSLLSSTQLTSNANSSGLVGYYHTYLKVYNVSALSNGDVAVSWNASSSTIGMYSFQTQVINTGTGSIDMNVTTQLTNPNQLVTLTHFDPYFWTETEAACDVSTIDSVSLTPTGGLSISWTQNEGPRGTDYVPLYSYQTHQSATFESTGIASPYYPSPITTTTTTMTTVVEQQPFTSIELFNPYTNPLKSLDLTGVYAYQTENSGGGKDLSSVFRALLSGKNPLAPDMAGKASPEAFDNLLKAPSMQVALGVPIKDMSPQEMEITTKLAGILKNPTEDQKLVLDTIKSILTDTAKIQENANGKANPELVKAQNDLLNAVANILLAQAVPDLLSKGDASNIKTIFQELDTQKNKIMLDYAKSTRPYYDNMLKDLAKNMAILQLKNILNSNMSKEELDKLPPSELDRILEKIKSMKDKSFEEEYLLQQEAKYRKEYIDPNKQKLEDDMKSMLNNFTGKINDVLKNAARK